MDLHQLSSRLDDLIQFGSSGIRRIGRVDLALRKRGITVTKRTTDIWGLPKTKVMDKPRDEADRVLSKALEKKATWKLATAQIRNNYDRGVVLRDNPNLQTTKLDPGKGFSDAKKLYNQKYKEQLARRVVLR